MNRALEDRDVRDCQLTFDRYCKLIFFICYYIGHSISECYCSTGQVYLCKFKVDQHLMEISHPQVGAMGAVVAVEAEVVEGDNARLNLSKITLLQYFC